MPQPTTSRPPPLPPPLQRQTAPPFLRKLYDIMDNSNDDTLIRWSDSGDSFLVLDPERFAQSLLHIYFKHRNWSTFVRQLNNYGFRKIQHLQQGALYGVEGDHCCEYAHPYFRRGQPDLLVFVERKKQDRLINTPKEPPLDLIPLRDVSYDHDNHDDHDHDRTTIPDPTILTEIMQTLSALEHKQTTISLELDTVKQSVNACRKGLNNHQDILMKILKFLAEVFGNRVHNNNNHPHHQHHHQDNHDDATTPSHNDDAKTSVTAVVPHRLMIQGSASAVQNRQDQELSRRFEVGSINTPFPQPQGAVVSPSGNPAITDLTAATQDSRPAAVNDAASSPPAAAHMRPAGYGIRQTTIKDTSTTSSHITATASSNSVINSDDVGIIQNVHPAAATFEEERNYQHHQQTFIDAFSPEQLVQLWSSALPPDMNITGGGGGTAAGLNDLPSSGLDPSSSFDSMALLPSTISSGRLLPVDMFGSTHFGPSILPNTTTSSPTSLPPTPTSFAADTTTTSASQVATALLPPPLPPPPISGTNTALLDDFDLESLLHSGFVEIWPPPDNNLNMGTAAASINTNTLSSDGDEVGGVVGLGSGSNKRKLEWMTGGGGGGGGGESFDSGEKRETEPKRRRAGVD